MRADASPDAIDARLVLRVHAAVATTAGLLVYCWPRAFLADAIFPAAEPLHAWSLARVAAAVAATSGVCAALLSRLDDPLSRAHALRAFAIAHIAFGVLFFAQWYTVLQPLVSPSLGIAPAVVGIVLMYLAATQVSEADGLGLDSLRSQYETHIQEAARQEERARLARDLHDAVKQQLFAIQASAATVEARFSSDTDGAKAALAQVRASAREATTEMETLIEQLQTAPLETSGLREALKRQCEALAFRTGADVKLVVGDLPPDMRLAPGAQQELFRGAQEALANVGRHARARHVTVTLGTQSDQLELVIEDDGAGFETGMPRTGMGLDNMRERARAAGGTFLLTARPGEGTTVRFMVPLRQQTLRQYAARAAFWFALLVLNIVLWRPAHVMAAAVSAIAIIAMARYLAAIVRLRQAGATWR